MNTTTVDTSAQLETVYAKVSRHLLPTLLLAYIVAYLDRVNVGFAKLQMLGDLHFSETVYGLGAGIFFIGYFIFGVPSNIMLHRLGARRWIATIMVFWGIVSASLAFVTTTTEFYVLRFLLGVAEAGFFPGVIFYLTQWYPAARRARANAIFMTGIAICGAIGSVLSGAIMQAFDDHQGLTGWQWLFIIEAAPAVLIGLYILARLSDGIQKAPWLSEPEKRLLSEEMARDGRAQTEVRAGEAFRDPRVWLGCIIYFCLIMGLYGTSFWLPTIISEMGVVGPLHIGLLSSIPYTIAAVGMVLVGRSADRRDERRWHVAIPAVIGALGLVIAVVAAKNVGVAMFGLSLAAFGILTATPLFWSIPTQYLQGTAAAAGIAIINSFGNLAGFVSPYLVGWMKDSTGSTASGMYVVSGFVFAAAVLVIAFVAAKPRPRP